MSRKSQRIIRMHNNHASFINIQCGQSLVEILITLVSSVLVLGLLISCYLCLTRHLIKQSSLNIIQQNAQSALKLLEREVHLAGFIGCARLADKFPIVTHTKFNLSSNDKLTSYLLADGQNGITLKYLEPGYSYLLNNMDNSYEIIIKKHSQLRPKDNLLISNCKRADIIEIDRIIKISPLVQKIITNKSLSYLYEKNSAIGLLQINSYTVENTKRKNRKGKSIYALYKKTIKGQQQELIEGVDSLFFRYTTNTEGKILELESNQVADWSKVVGVSLCMKLSSGPEQQPWCSYAALQQM